MNSICCKSIYSEYIIRWKIWFLKRELENNAISKGYEGPGLEIWGKQTHKNYRHLVKKKRWRRNFKIFFFCLLFFLPSFFLQISYNLYYFSTSLLSSGFNRICIEMELIIKTLAANQRVADKFNNIFILQSCYIYVLKVIYNKIFLNLTCFWWPSVSLYWTVVIVNFKLVYLEIIKFKPLY